MTKLEKILMGTVIGLSGLYAVTGVKILRAHKMLENEDQLLEQLQGVESVVKQTKKALGEES